jgi:hypothetical protein
MMIVSEKGERSGGEETQKGIGCYLRWKALNDNTDFSRE